MKLKRLNNPTVVGIFVLAAAFLAMGTIIFVASMKLFRAEAVVIVYFDESVNGLSIGSPVKFKGVPIGKVKDIRIAHNQRSQKTGSHIPVFLQIDLTKVGRKLDDLTIDFTDPDKFREVIRNGLRARLQLASFITGQLFVELDYYAEPGVRYMTLQVTPEYPEIPSIPSEMEEFGTSASNLMAQVASIDVKGINDRLIGLLEELDRVLKDFDIQGMNTAVIDTATSMQTTLEGLNLSETVPELRSTLDALRSVANKLESKLDPAVDEYHQFLTEVRATLTRSDAVLDNLELITDVDGTMQQEIRETMAALKLASQAARELLQYLERNPNAFITGRANP